MRLPRITLALATQRPRRPSARGPAKNRASPHETFSAVLGDRSSGNRVTITYGRPYAKSPKTGEVRKILGGLVPWDQPYRLGNDEALP